MAVFAELCCRSGASADAGRRLEAQTQFLPRRPKLDQFEYWVAPFRGTIVRGKDGPEAASEQLNAFIRHYQAQGWEFDRLGAIHMVVKPGCLASLFGATASVIAYDQVVFRRKHG
jgi:hypothetical protein